MIVKNESWLWLNIKTPACRFNYLTSHFSRTQFFIVWQLDIDRVLLGILTEFRLVTCLKFVALKSYLKNAFDSVFTMYCHSALDTRVERMHNLRYARCLHRAVPVHLPYWLLRRLSFLTKRLGIWHIVWTPTATVYHWWAWITHCFFGSRQYSV